jgi:hypothetical protein
MEEEEKKRGFSVFAREEPTAKDGPSKRLLEVFAELRRDRGEASGGASLVAQLGAAASSHREESPQIGPSAGEAGLREQRPLEDVVSDVASEQTREELRPDQGVRSVLLGGPVQEGASIGGAAPTEDVDMAEVGGSCMSSIVRIIKKLCCCVQHQPLSIPLLSGRRQL